VKSLRMAEAAVMIRLDRLQVAMNIRSSSELLFILDEEARQSAGGKAFHAP